MVPAVTVKIAAKTGKMSERLSSFDELWLRLYTDTSISDAELDRVQVELNQVGVEWLIQGVRCNWGKHPFNERGHEAYQEWLRRKAAAEHIWCLAGRRTVPRGSGGISQEDLDDEGDFDQMCKEAMRSGEAMTYAQYDAWCAGGKSRSRSASTLVHPHGNRTALKMSLPLRLPLSLPLTVLLMLLPLLIWMWWYRLV